MSLPIDPQRLRSDADAILELHEDGRFEEALAACDRLLERATDLTDPVVRESAFAAHFERASLLAEMGELDVAATAALDAAWRLPFDRDDPDQTHELAMLLVTAGTCLDNAGGADGALEVYDRLLAELGDAADPVTRHQVVRGRVNRAVTLLTLERFADAVVAARSLSAELDSADPAEAEQLAMAHRVRAAALRALARTDEAVVALAEAEALAAAAEGGTRAQVAAAQGERAELLVELGRAEEAIALLDETVDRFAGDPDVAPVVADLRRVEADLLEAAGQHDRAAALRTVG